MLGTTKQKFKTTNSPLLRVLPTLFLVLFIIIILLSIWPIVPIQILLLLLLLLVLFQQPGMLQTLLRRGPLLRLVRQHGH